MRVVNLTPHEIVVYDEGAVVTAFPQSGQVARIRENVSEARRVATDRGHVPVRSLSYASEIEWLPTPAKGTAYLVSRVLAAAIDREDLYFPGGEVRDETGQIIGCSYLGQFNHGGRDA